MSVVAPLAPARRTLLQHGAASLLGLMAGFVVVRFSTLETKWLAAVLALFALPYFLIAIGSLRASLLAMLVASLSIGMDVNPWYSDKFLEARKGVPIGATAVILAASLGLMLWGALRGSHRLRFYPVVTVPLLVVVLWCALSSLVALNPANVVYGFPMVLVSALIFVYASNSLGRPEDIRWIVLWIGITVALSSSLALLEFFTGGAVNLSFLGAREEMLYKQYDKLALARVSGALGHPNTLSFFLNGFLPPVAVYGVAVHDLRLKLLCFGAVVVGFVTLILTYARAGWMAFALSILVICVFFVTRRARIHFPRVWLRLLGVGALAAVVAVPFVPSILFRLTEDDYGAAYQRIPLMITALKVISANPVLGVGLGNYKESVPLYEANPEHDAGGRPNFVHNIYLHTAAETGIPTLIMFLWLCAVFTHRAVRCVFSPSREVSLFAIALSSGLLGMLSHGLVEPGTFGYLKFVWILFFGGLLVALDTLRRSEERRLPTPPAGRALSSEHRRAMAGLP